MVSKLSGRFLHVSRPPPEYLGRVFSIIFTAAGLLMPIGSFISQKIIKTDGLSGFVYIGLGIILIPCMYYILKLFKVRLEK